LWGRKKKEEEDEETGRDTKALRARPIWAGNRLPRVLALMEVIRRV
jgi:hypothetical protein